MSSQAWVAGVGGTALGVARIRAAESRRQDRLFEDPYAEAFLTAAPGAFSAELTRSGELSATDAVRDLVNSVIVRTRFFDDYLLAARGSGCAQVVLLAAGLDTRAFRLDWPDGTRLFELDLPDVLSFKDGVLAGQGAGARCSRTPLAVDLREGWADALTGAGFRPAEPTAWLVEGLMIYLSEDEATRLLVAIDELSAPGSQLSCEHATLRDSGLLDQVRDLPAMDRFTTLWKGGLGADLPGWLTRHGWTVETHERAAVAARYGRPVPGRSSGGFLTARREPATTPTTTPTTGPATASEAEPGAR